MNKYAFINQPKIINVKIYADLVPEDRKARVKGLFEMVNKTEEVIDSLHLFWGSPGAYKSWN